jgi:hypothetical protein
VVNNTCGSTTSGNAALTVNTPPTITTQPANQTVCQGANITFNVTASSPLAMSYQWRFNGANIAGATTSSFTTNSVQSGSAGNYSVVVNNTCGSTTSANAALTVNTPPTITISPASQCVALNGTATFSVTATGSAPLSYQWKKDGVDITGATTSSYSKSNVQLSDAGSYTVLINNSCGSATASAPLGMPPSITTQPANQCVALNGTATFSVTATGSAPLSYQWKKDGVNISSATTSSYSKGSVQVSDGGSYTVVINNSCGSATSTGATLGIIPSITTQPASQIVCQGANVTFSVVATGTTPLSYQWRKDGVSISAATTSTYTRSNVQTTDMGNYSVVVNNTCGPTTSTAAALTVNTPPAITAQPQSQTVAVNASVTLSVTASGSPAPSYLWQKNGVAIPGKTQSSLTFNPVQTSDAGDYAVTVANTCDTVVSATATLAVAIPPSITQQPQSLEVEKGDNATFNVAASGTGPFSYQWTFNGANIPGQTSASLTKIDAQTSDAGGYAVVVSNPGGSQPSYTANLGVSEAPRACAPSSYNLVAWWSAEGNPQDVAGTYGCHGTFHNESYSAGKVGQAFRCNGTTSYFEVSARPAMDVGPGNGLTIEAWVKPSDTSPGPIFEWAPSGASPYGVHLHVNQPGARGLYANVYGANGVAHPIQTATGLLVVGGWNHVALTYDKTSGQSKLFINGVVVRTESPGTFDACTAGILYLGHRPAGVPSGPMLFNGLIDEASLYNIALSDQEISAIFKARNIGKCPPPTVVVQATTPTVCENDDGYTSFLISRSGSTSSPLQVNYAFVGTALEGTDFRRVSPNPVTIAANQASAYVDFYPLADAASEPDKTVVLSISGSANYRLGSPSTATVTILDIPNIVSQPLNQSVSQGGDASFSVSATGSSPLSYQWYKNGSQVSDGATGFGSVISGATGSTLVIHNVQPGDAGVYKAIVSNSCSSLATSDAALTVRDTSDPDYDGIPNWLGGDYGSVRLGYWRMESAAFAGQPDIIYAGRPAPQPRSAVNVQCVASWQDNAARVESASPAVLRYNDIQPDGTANINCRVGTVRFWFSPSWTSGAGPGAAGKLISVGSGWELAVNAQGTQLSFSTVTDGTHLTANISWAANEWHYVCLTYSATSTALYIDGIEAVTGSGVAHYPDASARTAAGLNVGAHTDGTMQSKGVFDELETYNYQQSSSEIASADGQGNGLPDVWEQQNFAATGVDPYGDPDNDGWANVQEYQRGTNPQFFNTPPIPTGLSVRYYGPGSPPVVTWNSSPGAVTGYIIRRHLPNYGGPNGQTDERLVDDNVQSISDWLLPSDFTLDSKNPPTFKVIAVYEDGNSESSERVTLFNPELSVDSEIVRGEKGSLFLAVSALPPTIRTLRVRVEPLPPEWVFDFYYPSFYQANYLWEDPQVFTPAVPNGSFDIDVSQLQNGRYEFTTQVPKYGAYHLTIEPIASDGCRGQPKKHTSYPEAYRGITHWQPQLGLVPFLDGRGQIKENVEFLLRAAIGPYPYYYIQGGGAFRVKYGRNIGNSQGVDLLEEADPNYVWAGFHCQGQWYPGRLLLDAFRPFEQNHFYANFLYSPANVN